MVLYIPSMVKPKFKTHRHAEASRVKETAALAAASQKRPGVAELLELYERHAETVRRANNYTTPGRKVVFVLSSGSTA